jgi:hypothetical protein
LFQAFSKFTFYHHIYVLLLTKNVALTFSSNSSGHPAKEQSTSPNFSQIRFLQKYYFPAQSHLLYIHTHLVKSVIRKNWIANDMHVFQRAQQKNQAQLLKKCQKLRRRVV